MKKNKIIIFCLTTLALLLSCSSSEKLNSSKKLDMTIDNQVKEEVLQKMEFQTSNLKIHQPYKIKKEDVEKVGTLNFILIPSFKFDENRLRISNNFDSIENFLVKDPYFQIFYGVNSKKEIEMVYFARKIKKSNNTESFLSEMRSKLGDSITNKYLESKEKRLPFQDWYMNGPSEITSEEKTYLENAFKNADNKTLFSITIHDYPYYAYYKKGSLVMFDTERVLNLEDIKRMMESESKRLKSGRN